MLKIKSSASYMLATFGFLSFVAITYFIFVPIDDVRYVSTDSKYYRDLSIEYCDQPLEPIMQVFEGGVFVSLNWSTIVSAGAFSCDLSTEYADWITLGINLIVLFLSLLVYQRIIGRIGFSTKQKIVFYLLFCLQAFLVVSLISLNKEVLSYYFLVLLLYLYIESNRAALLVVGLIAGLLKVQFFLISLVLMAMLFRLRFWVILIVLSLALPLVYAIFDPSIFDARQYFDRYEYQIRTEKIAIVLNEVAAYPLGYLAVMPLRMLINALSGLSPLRILSANDFYSLAYQINAMIFSFSVILLVWKVVKRKINVFGENLLRYILVYSMIICLLPFFQLRYFLPLFPIITILLLSKHGKWKEMSVKPKNYSAFRNDRE